MSAPNVSSPVAVTPARSNDKGSMHWSKVACPPPQNVFNVQVPTTSPPQAVKAPQAADPPPPPLSPQLPSASINVAVAAHKASRLMIMGGLSRLLRDSVKHPWPRRRSHPSASGGPA